MLALNGVAQGLPASESSARHRKSGGYRSHLHVSSISNSATDSTVRGAWSTSTVSRGQVPGTKRYPSIGKRVGLCVDIKGTPVHAMVDTGCEGNCIREDFAQILGLQVQETENCKTKFQLANGREISSIGTASVSCLLGPQVQSKYSEVVFDVFTSLAAPVIVGKELLQTTETLTKNFEQLSTYDDNWTHLNMPRVLYLNRPQQRLRCFLKIDLVYADADTGSDLNLISPEFTAQRELRIEKLEGQRRRLCLQTVPQQNYPDSSALAFFPFENRPNKFNSRLRTPEEFFYIFEGLTTDVLIGADILFKISAFTEQQSAFVDLEEQGIVSNINTISWLSKREKVLNALNREPSNTNPATCTELEVAFQIELNDDDTANSISNMSIN